MKLHSSHTQGIFFLTVQSAKIRLLGKPKPQYESWVGLLGFGLLLNISTYLTFRVDLEGDQKMHEKPS